MATNDEKATQATATIENASVNLTPDQKLQVEFRIEDLVRRLMPSSLEGGHCGGCNGCSGCSM